MPEGSNSVETDYRTRRDQAATALARLDRLGGRIANGRAATFLGALAAAGLSVFGRIPKQEGWSAVALLLVTYVALAVWHERVIRREQRARLLKALNERGLARIGGGWREFPGTGERFAQPAHPYTPDLDVFGQGSLFQLIDESGTRSGEAALASWLQDAAGAEEVLHRQRAVRELAGKLDLRQSLCVECRLASQEKADPARFLAWAENPGVLPSIAWSLPLAWLLPILFAGASALAYAGRVSSWAPLAAFAGLVATAGLTRRALQHTHQAISAGERGFVRFERVFRLLEDARFEDPRLRALQGRLRASGAMPSAVLVSFSRRYAFAELRQAGQLFPLIHLFTLWDIHWTFALERWRRRYGAALRPWFDALAEWEALSSLAGLAHARPGLAYPTVKDGAPFYEAQALGHPLLDAPVTNDVSLPAAGAALIVTGSNMAGKTTLLRALGTNAVLALAGAPVCARALSLSHLQVLTGMRVKDSLERGVSYFYAEVQRLKQVLDAARAANGRALFLLDEVLLGTNARERQVASKEILRLLLETGAIGGVATHDLTLAALEANGSAAVRNVHFEDQIRDGKMTFDYRLRDGVVQGTNALRVLQQSGIDVRES